MAAGRFDRLVPFCEQVVQARRLKLGNDHPDTLTWMDNLAKVYERTGDSHRAVSLHEQVLTARRSKLGEDHPETILARRDMAVSYLEAGRYSEAEPLCRQLVAALGRGEQRNEPIYCESLAVLGRCLSLEDKHAEGVSALGDCLKIAEKTRPDDWTTVNFRSFLGEALSRRRSFAEAERLLLASHQGLVERSLKIPPHQRHEVLRRSFKRLIQLYEAWNKPIEAERWRQQLPPVVPQPPDSGKDGTRNARRPAALPGGH
jgi:eukaryotic-like serine/threonine-protein kinase